MLTSLENSRWLSVPVLMQLTKDDPEKAHELAIKFLESGLTPKDLGVDDERLAFEVCILSLPYSRESVRAERKGRFVDSLVSCGARSSRTR